MLQPRKVIEIALQKPASRPDKGVQQPENSHILSQNATVRRRFFRDVFLTKPATTIHPRKTFWPCRGQLVPCKDIKKRTTAVVQSLLTLNLIPWKTRCKDSGYLFMVQATKDIMLKTARLSWHISNHLFKRERASFSAERSRQHGSYGSRARLFHLPRATGNVFYVEESSTTPSCFWPSIKIRNGASNRTWRT